MVNILNQNELDHLADVIGQVELTTSGEIRLMIVKRSALTGHVHLLLWSLLVSLTFMTVELNHLQSYFGEQWWVWPAFLLVAYVLTGFLTRISFLQRLLTPHQDLHHQVLARAEVEFHREGLSGTKAHTGVLLFVSLFERQAVVLADEGIAGKTPPEAWDQVVKTIVDGARHGQWAAHFEKAIRECGAYLASHFPPSPTKGNELPNTVIIKD